MLSIKKVPTFITLILGGDVMKLDDIKNIIKRRIPTEWAEDWDNTGLLIGDPTSDIKKIAVSLDFTEDSVKQAVSNECQMMITHHPAIFHPLKSIVLYKSTQKAIALAIKEDIAVYALHTNWDSSPEGVNFCLAQKLGLTNIKPLIRPNINNGAWGLGAVGDLQEKIDMKKCMKLLKDKWEITESTGFGDISREIKKVAIGGGACGDLWEYALGEEADVFITSDVSYNLRLELLSMGLNLILADHGEVERVSLLSLSEIIKEETSLPVIILKEKDFDKITV